MDSSSLFRSRGALRKHDSCTLHSSVLHPKALAPRILRRKGWHRGTLKTCAIRFYPHRRHKQQHQQVIQPPEPAPQKGPSRVGLAVLLGAGLLLIATWHKLTSRGTAEAQRERQAAINQVAQEAAQGKGGPWGTQQESSEKEEGARVTGQEIQARMQQVKAAIEAARAANRPDILRNEVIELKSLRDLAADLYSFNTMTIEAQEVQSKMASLRKQHAELMPAEAPSQHEGSDLADSMARDGSAADEGPQQGNSLVSAFTGTQLFETGSEQRAATAGSTLCTQEDDMLLRAEEDSGSARGAKSSSADEGAEKEASLAESRLQEEAEYDEADEEVAALASALWEDAGGDSEAETQVEAEPPGQLNSSSVREGMAPESVSSNPRRGLEGLERLQDEAQRSMSSAAASSVQAVDSAAGYGSAATAAEREQHAEHNAEQGLEIPLRCGEKEQLKELQLELHAGGVNIPHPAKAETGGEDAFFISKGAVGVADGVSAWAREGINAALYSSCIMEHAEKRILTSNGSSSGYEVLQHSSTYCAGVDGSSTAVIAVLQPPNMLEVTNLGDCGFRIFREGQCIFASNAQQHSFNCPYQLASPTKWPEADKPEDADVYEVELLPGDIVVLGSDGLFDNMWNHEMEVIVRDHIKAGAKRTDTAAKELALDLANTARDHALNKNYRSPWILEAAAAGKLPIWQRLRPCGGKLDDCTAVVVFAELVQPVQVQEAGHGAPATAGAA